MNRLGLLAIIAVVCGGAALVAPMSWPGAIAFAVLWGVLKRDRVQR